MSVGKIQRESSNFQYGRLKELLTFFVFHEEFSISADVAKYLGISERTLRSDICNLNEILKRYDAEIIQRRRKGYILQSKSINVIKDLLKEQENSALDSADERINYLIITLLYEKEYMSQSQLADAVYVSTNTILNYLKAIRTVLKEYELKLLNKVNCGYKIIGSETNKRLCLMNLFESSLYGNNFTFWGEQVMIPQKVNLEKIQKIVLKFNKKNGFSFSDYNLRNLVLRIGIASSRIQNGFEIQSYEILQSEKMTEILEPLKKSLEQVTDIVFNESEKKYMYSCYILNANNFPTAEVIDMKYVNGLVRKVLREIYDCYQIDVMDDAILERDLARHFQSILWSKYYYIDKKNPLLDTIRQNYLLYYEITETAVYQAFQNESFSMSADDIGYMCLHIGAAVRRYFDARNIKYRRAVIVNLSGYSVGNLIESQLNSLFDGKLKIVGKVSLCDIENMDLSTVDFLISTVPLQHIKIPVVVIDIPLKKHDIENIFQEIVMGNAQRFQWLEELFRKDCFLHLDCNNKEEVIHEISNMLLENGYVKEDFEEKVMERENRIPTIMDQVIAVPHPMQICALKNAVAVGILDRPIPWGTGRNAQIVVMLALSTDYEKNIEELYDILLTMMDNTELQKSLLESRAMEEFLEILRENLH